MLLDALDDACVLLIEASTGHRFTARAVRDRAARLSSWERGVAFLVPDGTAEAACWFLALLEAHYPVALIDAGLGWSSISGLAERYRPDVLVDPGCVYIEEFQSKAFGVSGSV